MYSIYISYIWLECTCLTLFFTSHYQSTVGWRPLHDVSNHCYLWLLTSTLPRYTSWCHLMSCTPVCFLTTVLFSHSVLYTCFVFSCSMISYSYANHCYLHASLSSFQSVLHSFGYYPNLTPVCHCCLYTLIIHFSLQA